jgi:hypothetical protein
MNAALESRSSRTRDEIVEVADFRCPGDNKLLTKTILRVKNVNLSDAEFNRFLSGVKITNGAQDKCRTCKTIRTKEDTLTV